MTKYLVSVSYQETGQIYVEAKSKEEAEDKAQTAMADEGMKGLEDLGFDVHDREYEVLEVEEQGN